MGEIGLGAEILSLNYPYTVLYGEISQRGIVGMWASVGLIHALVLDLCRRSPRLEIYRLVFFTNPSFFSEKFKNFRQKLIQARIQLEIPLLKEDNAQNRMSSFISVFDRLCFRRTSNSDLPWTPPAALQESGTCRKLLLSTRSTTKLNQNPRGGGKRRNLITPFEP